MKFDNVIGNPPYEHTSVQRGNVLWHKFVEQALKAWMNEHGYLSMVHPPLWRKPQTQMSRCRYINEMLLKRGTLINLNMNSTKVGSEMFNAVTPFDYYLYTNQELNINVCIHDYNNNTDNVNNNASFIPNHSHQIIDNLLMWNNSNYCNVICNGNYVTSTDNFCQNDNLLSKTQTSKYKYPVVTSTPTKGVQLVYSKRNDKGHFGIPKVIFGESSYKSAFIDMDGEYGMNQSVIGIVIDNEEEGKRILKAMNTDTFARVFDACTWRQFGVSWKVFEHFKKDWYEEILRIENE